MEIAIVIVNLILLFYFTRMAIHSRQVQVAGKLGPTWIITVFFVGIGIIRLAGGALQPDAQRFQRSGDRSVG